MQTCGKSHLCAGNIKFTTLKHLQQQDAHIPRYEHSVRAELCGLELFLISNYFSCVIAAKRSMVRGRLEDAGSERVQDGKRRQFTSFKTRYKQFCSVYHTRRDKIYFCVAFIEIHPFTIVSVIIKMQIYIKWMLYRCHLNWK